MAETLRAQGDLDGARRFQENVLEVRRRVLGEEHPNTLTSMNNLASTLKAQGDLEGARELIEKALEVRRRVLGEKHPNTTSSQWNLLQTLIAQKETAAANTLKTELAWLRAADPTRLSAGQKKIRSMLGFDDED
ncbi:MAG: hypothetical protein AUK47_18360 [Deltaproteobacteria bacterium CG2_30_63_29]|nr:MAG: hypothetical protein AUK47_18360 [Deltaproteobacteria bacterium CG2_30_63_29]PJB36470.1 MAG: hypothetical protein CO108_23330 [Deltaproteobacteria bacterium CG_4_9_14_3_um_filter_63_12]